MPFPFAPILLGSQLLVSAHANVPNVNIHKTCEAGVRATAELMADSSAERDMNVCMSSEQAARQQIIKDWASYSSSEKAQCVQPSVYSPSYVEWLTCLEMAKSVRETAATTGQR
jgi:hypothetical protein